MTEKAIIFHGTDSTPQSFWYPNLAENLMKRGFEVSVPHYPNLNHEPVNDTLAQALRDFTFDESTVLIGHSAGSPLILAILGEIESPVRQSILVAGYARKKGNEKESDPVLKTSYNWVKIAKNAGDIIFINSDNDPWGCNDEEGRYMLDQIGKGKLIVMKGEGHMGSDSYNQPYKDFPLLERLIG